MQRAFGFAEQGNQLVLTAGVFSTNAFQESWPMATITVFFTGTTVLAEIFSDNQTMPTPLSNPFTANAFGWWWFYAANGRYDVMIDNGIQTPWTIGDIQLFDAAGFTPALAAGSGITLTPLVEPAATLISSDVYVWQDDVNANGYDLNNVGNIGADTLTVNSITLNGVEFTGPAGISGDVQLNINGAFGTAGPGAFAWDTVNNYLYIRGTPFITTGQGGGYSTIGLLGNVANWWWSAGPDGAVVITQPNVVIPFRALPTTGYVGIALPAFGFNEPAFPLDVNDAIGLNGLAFAARFDFVLGSPPNEVQIFSNALTNISQITTVDSGIGIIVPPFNPGLPVLAINQYGFFCALALQLSASNGNTGFSIIQWNSNGASADGWFSGSWTMRVAGTGTGSPGAFLMDPVYAYNTPYDVYGLFWITTELGNNKIGINGNAQRNAAPPQYEIDLWGDINISGCYRFQRTIFPFDGYAWACGDGLGGVALSNITTINGFPPGGGGGAIPGGPSGAIQYNNQGGFGGNSNLTTNGTDINIAGLIRSTDIGVIPDFGAGIELWFDTTVPAGKIESWDRDTGTPLTTAIGGSPYILLLGELSSYVSVGINLLTPMFALDIYGDANVSSCYLIGGVMFACNDGAGGVTLSNVASINGAAPGGAFYGPWTQGMNAGGQTLSNIPAVTNSGTLTLSGGNGQIGIATGGISLRFANITCTPNSFFWVQSSINTGQYLFTIDTVNNIITLGGTGTLTSPRIALAAPVLTSAASLPTSSAGLAAGTLWNNGGVVSVA